MSNDIDLANLGEMAKKAQTKVSALASLSTSASDLGDKYERLKSSEGKDLYITVDFIWSAVPGGMTHRISYSPINQNADQLRDLVVKQMGAALRDMLDTLYKQMDVLNE
jgi:hypothetical protein